MITNLRQVDEAFITKIQGLQIPDDNGVLKDVPVLYINPEGEFEVESYPTFVVYRSGAYPDLQRWDNSEYTIGMTYYDNGNPATETDIANPEPYIVYYSVRLYYIYQGDGVEMNTHLMKTIKRGAYLAIDSDKYDVELVSYKNPNSTYRQFGIEKEDKPKEFIDQYLYKLDINLYDGATTTKQYLKPESEGGGIVITTHIK